MWVVSAPTSVKVSKNKSFSLNLNVYRNAHHHTLNKAKTTFAEIMEPIIKELPDFLAPIRISYILYPRTRMPCDVANICCIVDKFFSDCLVTQQKLPDDNYNHLTMVAYGFGEISKDNPRVDVIIELA